MLARNRWRCGAVCAPLALLSVLGWAAACGSGDEFSSGSGASGDASAGTRGGGSGGTSSGGSGGSVTTGGSGGSGNAATEGGAGASGAAGADAGCQDGDSDGVTDCAGDCDDADPTSLPGGSEVCGDGADNDCLAGPDDGCNALGTWVSANTGDDTYPGTQAKPVKTIAQGIANAQAIITSSGRAQQTVFVGEGHYGEKVTLVEGISLFGGYQCTTASCTWQRDRSQYDSAILNTDFEGVVARFGVTRQTKLDGFRVMGMGGLPTTTPGSAAITLDGGSATITSNRVVGGTLTGGGIDKGTSIGIHISGASGGATPPPGPLVQNNDIAGGNTPEVSAGVEFGTPRGFVWGSGTPPPTTTGEIVGNKIRAGSGRSAYGIRSGLTVAGTRIFGNDISGGTAAAGESWAIGAGDILLIDTNRLNLDASAQTTCASSAWCGGVVSWRALLVITNNVIFGASAQQSAAVRLQQVEGAAREVVLSSNYLSGGPPPAANSTAPVSAGIVLTNNGCSGCATARIGRIRNNILDGGAGTKRYGVYEETNTNTAFTVHPDRLDNNDFFFAGSSDVLYRYWIGTAAPSDMVNLSAVNLLLFSAQNFTGDPLVDAAFHLDPTSPCINAGIDTDAPPLDFDGDQRPLGNLYDVGPDEAQ